MSELMFTSWVPRPSVTLRFDDGRKILLRSPEFAINWRREEYIHKADGGRRTRKIRGHRAEIRMRWSMMPAARLQGAGQDRDIAGHLALQLADEQNSFLFSMTGLDPWIRVYTSNTQKAMFTAGDAVPEGEALYKSQDLITPSQLMIGWGAAS